MSAKGIVRRMDPMGRIVLPMELRRTMDLEPGDELEILPEGESIVLRKYEPYCVFCGRAGRLTGFCGKNVCAGCLKALREE